MKNLNTLAKTITLAAALSISACATESDNTNNTGTGSGTTPTTVVPTSLNQAAYAGGTVYDYGHNSVPNIPFTGAPADTDFSRWAMLHDGTTYRLYFFKEGTNDTLYQFGYNAGTQSYEFGFMSISELNITNIPTDADTSSFAMLHDGSVYRLYMRSLTSDTTLYQFGYNSSTQDYEYGHLSIPTLFITMAPVDTDHARWGMLHDGTNYRLYIGKTGEADTMYQFAYNISSSDYEWGYVSIPQLNITDMPADSIKTDFAMLHDGSDYRFYYHSDL